MTSKPVFPGRGKPSANPPPKLTPEARRLLAALEAAFAATRAPPSSRGFGQQNAERLIDDYHAHSGIMTFNPPWLLTAARAVASALRGVK